MPAAMTDGTNELRRLIALAERERSRTILQAELERRLRAAAAAAAAAAASPPSQQRTPPPSAPPPVLLSKSSASSSAEFAPISNYAWDHGNKFVKVYLTLPGLAQLPEAQIEVEFAERSLRVSVTGLSAQPTNRRLAVPVLCASVRPEQCSWARKASDMLLLKLRKAEDGGEWGSLDNSSAKKEAHRKERTEANQGKSTAELLQQMYAEADEDGKAALSKAWEEGREKREGKKQE